MVNIRKGKGSKNLSSHNRTASNQSATQNSDAGNVDSDPQVIRPSQLVEAKDANASNNRKLKSLLNMVDFAKEGKSLNDEVNSDKVSDDEEADGDSVKHEKIMGLLPAAYPHQKGNKVHDLESATKEEVKIQKSRKSGLGILFSDDVAKVHHEDFDAGVNAMALLCALVLSIPFEIIGNINYENLDHMKEEFNECDKEDLELMTFDDVYATYRGSFLATVYWAIAGMILATFYFLFKRMNDDEYKLWRWKARYLVISLFFCTAFAICSLILLTNMYFDYYLLASSHDICDNGTFKFVLPGLSVASFAFIWGIYLAW